MDRADFKGVAHAYDCNGFLRGLPRCLVGFSGSEWKDYLAWGRILLLRSSLYP
jgi:hypothetical protein